jgi:hypothetical protein
MPYTPAFMAAIHTELSLNQPFNTVVWACLTVCFYAAARVGELTVPQLTSFDPSHHVTLSNLRREVNKDQLEATVLHIPQTKAAPMEGEDIFWSRQHGPTDPYEAMDLHFQVNKPSGNDHLFSYTLTKQAFIKQLALAAHAASLDPLQGHGIRIGSTLHYLMSGVPMEVMKAWDDGAATLSFATSVNTWRSSLPTSRRIPEFMRPFPCRRSPFSRADVEHGCYISIRVS